MCTDCISVFISLNSVSVYQCADSIGIYKCVQIALVCLFV